MMFCGQLSILIALLPAMRAQKACDSLDDGPFLGTKPTLVMEVFEATNQELLTNPGSDMYQDELRLVGSLDDTGMLGISLEVMNNFRLFNPLDYFRFNHDAVSSRNMLLLVNPIDREGPSDSNDDDIDMFSFTLKCVPVHNTSLEVFYDVRILIKDVNDNVPLFTETTYSVEVNELTTVGTKLIQVSATDNDFITNSNITYNIVPANSRDVSSMFRIDPSTGDITLEEPLDFESMSRDFAYTFDISATDSDLNSPRSSRATVMVKTLDGDDQGPAFEYQGCFRHKGTCAWPKYTSYINQMKMGQVISVYPVPNKVGHTVVITAKDLDPSQTDIKFSIASTIPPGYESHFSVETYHASGGLYGASIRQTRPLQISEGFEIFLKAEEQSSYKRHEIAMIYFMGQKAPSDNNTESKDEKPDKSPLILPTSGSMLALIVVVSILGTFVVCLGLSFIVYVFRRKNTTKGDIMMT